MTKRYQHPTVMGMFIIVLLYIPLTVKAAVPYMPVDTGYANYHTGYQEVYNSTEGTNYGKAKIEWNYWFNSENSYWYYAYKVYNNESGTPGNRTDDYHFGHIYNSDNYDPVIGFDLDFPVQIPKITGDELVVASTLAGSTSGTTAWDSLANEVWDGAKWVTTGVNWSTTAGDEQALKPTQWAWEKIGSTYNWVQIYAGDTSRTDAGGYQYFEIASKWAPGPISAHISNDLVTSDTTAFGSIYGPAVVPEPATCLILGFGCGFVFLSSRRRKSR